MIAGAGVAEPANIGTPSAKVETTFMREIEASLERGLLVRLRQSAEYVLAVDAEVAGECVGWLRGLASAESVTRAAVWASAP
jgi:hypothetical protein